MPLAALDDPVLKRFRAALDELYGDRVERVVLFGSPRPRRRTRGFGLRRRGVPERSKRPLARTEPPGGSQHRHSLRNRRVHPRHGLPRRLLRRAHAADARNPLRRHRFMSSPSRRLAPRFCGECVRSRQQSCQSDSYGEKSRIEWTDHTFNPWWGCIKVSPAYKDLCTSLSRRVGRRQGDQANGVFLDGAWTHGQVERPGSDQRRGSSSARVGRCFCRSRDLTLAASLGLDTPQVDLPESRGPEKVAQLVPAPDGGMYRGYHCQGAAIDRMRFKWLASPTSAGLFQQSRYVGPLESARVGLNLNWVITGGESGPERAPRARLGFGRCWPNVREPECRFTLSNGAIGCLDPGNTERERG